MRTESFFSRSLPEAQALLFERLWSKPVFVSWSKSLLRFFFKPVHLHGGLADLSGVIFLFPVPGEIFLLPIVLAGVIEGFGALFQKIFFPISQKIGKKAVFRSQRVEVLLSFKKFDTKVSFKL